jgi:hypothetical protein
MGQIWWCKKCGFEIKVHKACGCGEGEDACGDDCKDFECCGEQMELKEE